MFKQILTDLHSFVVKVKSNTNPNAVHEIPTAILLKGKPSLDLLIKISFKKLLCHWYSNGSLKMIYFRYKSSRSRYSL